MDPDESPPPLTGRDIRAARGILGRLWGLGRPLRMSEMGRALRLSGSDVGRSIRDYERDKTRITGPLSVAVEMMVHGAPPPDGMDSIVAWSRRNGRD